jgi:hypothetical protein
MTGDQSRATSSRTHMAGFLADFFAGRFFASGLVLSGTGNS